MTRIQARDAEPSDLTFRGFGDQTLLETGNIPIAELAGIAVREGHSTSDLFRVHRWFARRLSSQFRAILTGLALGGTDPASFWQTYLGVPNLGNAVVLDPFVGGGTSVVEASRCGARVIGYDIDPVAAWITRFELGVAQKPVDTSEIERICSTVSSQIAPLHQTRVDGADYTVLHHFWVEVKTCPECARRIDLHPHHQLAYDTAKKLQWAFCADCGTVCELPIDQQTMTCGC